MVVDWIEAIVKAKLNLWRFKVQYLWPLLVIYVIESTTNSTNTEKINPMIPSFLTSDLANQMMDFWSLAGHDEATLKDFVARNRPATR